MFKNERRAGVLLQYAALAINSIVGILYTPFLLRLMGQSEYGLYSLAASIIAYLSIFDLGLGNAVIRYTAKYRANGDKASESRLNGMILILYSLVGLIVLSIGLFLSNNIGLVFSESLTDIELNKSRILLIILTINLSVSFPLSLFTSLMTAYEKFIFPRIISIVRIILIPCIMIPLLFLGYRSIAMVIVLSITNTLVLLINVIYCLFTLKIKIVIGKLDFSLLKGVIYYSFFIFLNILIEKIYMSTDQLLLGALRGTVSVSIYAISMQLYNYYLTFSTAINGVFLPKVTILVEKENCNKKINNEISDLFVKTARIQFLVLSLILVGFINFGKDFIVLWAGKQYLNSYYICLIIMIPAIVPLSQNLGIVVLQAKNKHQFRSVLYLVIAVINIAISIPLVKLYGGIGAAIGTTLATVVGQIATMNYYYYKRIGIDIPRYWNQIIRLSGYSLISLIVGIILNKFLVELSWLTLMIKISLFSGFYLFLTWMRALNDYEKGLIKSIFASKYRKEV